MRAHQSGQQNWGFDVFGEICSEALHCCGESSFQCVVFYIRETTSNSHSRTSYFLHHFFKTCTTSLSKLPPCVGWHISCIYAGFVCCNQYGVPNIFVSENACNTFQDFARPDLEASFAKERSIVFPAVGTVKDGPPAMFEKTLMSQALIHGYWEAMNEGITVDHFHQQTWGTFMCTAGLPLQAANLQGEEERLSR